MPRNIVKFYLGKWFWSILPFCALQGMLVESSVLRLWTFALTAKHNPTTSLIYIRPKGRWTFVVSLVFPVWGAETKMRQISYFRNRANRQALWLLAFTPWGILDPTPQITRGGPNITIHRISNLVLIANSCDKAQLRLQPYMRLIYSSMVMCRSAYQA